MGNSPVLPIDPVNALLLHPKVTGPLDQVRYSLSIPRQKSLLRRI